MPRPSRVLATWLTVALAALLAACGGDDGSGTEAAGGDAETTEQVQFPAAGESGSLRALRAALPEGPIFAPAVSLLQVDERNRLGFALFDRGGKGVTSDHVAVYTAKPDGTDLRGPYRAERKSLDVKPQFRSRQTAADLEDNDSFYVAHVPFDERGTRIVTALAQVDGKLMSTSQLEMRVGARGGPPEVGEPAVRVSTPTVADAGGDLSQIDTRLPPLRELHDTDFLDVVGKRPAVLVFATPQLCASRVCGPVVDVAAQVAASTPDAVEFIHMEIYRDNKLDKGFRPQVARWRLPTEPWTFVVDRRGRIAERFEGPVSVEELQDAVDKVA